MTRHSNTHSLACAAVVFALWHAEIQAVPVSPVLNQPQVAGSTVTLSWTVPPGTTAIRLEAGTAPGLSDAANAVVGAISGYSATSVPAGLYYVRVRAIDPTGESAPSNEVTVVVAGGSAPGCFTAPDPPTAFRVTASGPTSVSLAWTPARTGCPATSFILQAGTATELSDLAILDVGPAVSFTAVVPALVGFYGRVVARNAYGTSVPSNEILVSTIPVAPPNAAALCPAPVPGTVNGCWVGYTYYGDGLTPPPGFCAGAKYHLQFVLRQSESGAVTGSYETTLIIPSSNCPLPSHRVGQRATVGIAGAVVGDSVTFTVPFAPGAPVPSPFVATFTGNRITGSFTLDGVAGVTAPGTFAVSRR